MKAPTSISLCAIINIRCGKCGMDCKFCIQSNPAFQGFPMLDSATLRARILSLAEQPVERIGLVASGKALGDSEFGHLLESIQDLPAKIKRRLCCSLGQLPADKMRRLRDCGVTRYHHNLETSESFYPALCRRQNWRDRHDTVRRAQGLGLSVCSGAIFGVGESWADRENLAHTLKDLGIINIPLNFLHPQPGTPLENKKPLTADEGLEIIRLFRRILPEAALRVCGGRPITFGARQSEIFAAGANALMTGDYLTTRGAALASDLAMLADLDLEPASF